MKDYFWRFDLQIPYELEESILWKLQILGIHSFAIEKNVDKPYFQRLSIWISSFDWSKQKEEELMLSFSSLAEIFGISLSLPELTKIDNEDWNQSWKEHWSPDPVGNNLLILPSWLEMPEKFSHRKVVRIDPGRAFGTGSHPSTRLCLEALERESLEGVSVADIGCGSGILSLTSLCFGAQKVFAVDTDSLAVKSTMDNFLLNNFQKDSLFVCKGSIEMLHQKLQENRVDLLLCNILAPVIKQLVPSFEKILNFKGRAFLSGILIDQIADLAECLEKNDWEVTDSFERNNWALIEIHRS